MSCAREAQLFRFRAFNPEVQIGLIKGLLNPQVSCSRNVSHFRQQRVGIAPISLQVLADNLNIDRGWKSKIQNLSDHVRRQKVEASRPEIALAASWRSW